MFGAFHPGSSYCAQGVAVPVAIALTLGACSASPSAHQNEKIGTENLFPDSSFSTLYEAPSAAALSTGASIGVRSKGRAYFAAIGDREVMTVFPGPLFESHIPTGGEPKYGILFALNGPPEQLADPDEPHWLMSVHVIGAAQETELFSLGVTPSLRLCVKDEHRPVLYSAPNLVPTDGSFHVAAFEMVGASRYIHFDDIGFGSGVVAFDSIVFPDARTGGPFSSNDLAARLMLFNGAAGRTKVDCSIMYFFGQASGQEVVWPLNEGSGAIFNGYEGHLDLDDGHLVLKAVPDFVDGNGDPTVPDMIPGWFDPSPLPLLYGSVPNASPLSAWHWLNKTKYRPQPIGRPGYDALVPSVPSYDAGSISRPGYRVLDDVEETL